MSTTILFLPSPSTSGSWGSTLRLAQMAEECRIRGDRTVFHACPPTDRLLRERDFDVVTFDGLPARDLTRPVEDFYDVCYALAFDDRDYWADLLRQEDELVRAVRPDVLVADMRPTAAILAARHGIPLACCAWWGADPRYHATGTHPYDEMAGALARDWSPLRPDTLAD